MLCFSVLLAALPTLVMLVRILLGTINYTCKNAAMCKLVVTSSDWPIVQISVLPIADFFFHHSYPIPIFNDVIMLSVDQIKVTSLILIWILDYVLGDIALKKIFIVQVKLKL